MGTNTDQPERKCVCGHKSEDHTSSGACKHWGCECESIEIVPRRIEASVMIWDPMVTVVPSDDDELPQRDDIADDRI